MWGGDGASGAVQNPILVAIPCFIFMGTMLERSRVAADLLHILQVVLKRVPAVSLCRSPSWAPSWPPPPALLALRWS